MKWPLTFYVKNLSGNTLGRSKGPFIFILDSCKDNDAIYEHELTHVVQWAITTATVALAWAILCAVPEMRQYLGLAILAPVVDPLLYTAVPAYRLWAEVGAYKVQISCGTNENDCAYSLAHDYGLNITQAEALARLKG